MKTAIAAFLVLAAVWVFAGGDTESKGTEGPVRLVTTFWGGGVKAKAFEDTARDYMKENANVKIELISIPGDYASKVLAMIAGGTPPDVININPDLATPLKDQLVPLSKRMADLGYYDPKDGLWEGWWDMLALEGAYKKGDEIYQAPLGTGSDVLAYNKKLFDQAGVAYPTEKWTWEGDFLTAAQKLSQQKDRWGITGFPYRGRNVLGPIAKAFGADIYDLKAMKFTGDDPRVVKAFQFGQDLIYKYKVHPTPAEEQAFGGPSGGPFTTQVAAMYILPTFEFPPLYTAEFPWDIQMLPGGPNGSWSDIYGGKLAILKTTKALNHSLAFVNMINGPVGQGYFSVSSGFNNPPLKKIAYSEAFMKGPKGAPANNAARVKVLEKAVVVEPSLPNGNKINTAWGKKFSLFWQNKLSAADMMQQLKAEIQPLLDAK